MIFGDVGFRIFPKWSDRALAKDFGKPQLPGMVRSRALKICLEAKPSCSTLAQAEPVGVIGRMHAGGNHVQHGGTES